MGSHLALLSTISSRGLPRITLIFDVNRLVCGGEPNQKVSTHKEWGTVEDVFLWLTASSVVIGIVALLWALDRPSSVLKCGTFMPRFKEVGKVKVRFP